jgi:hypothetical protein
LLFQTDDECIGVASTDFTTLDVYFRWGILIFIIAKAQLPILAGAPHEECSLKITSDQIRPSPDDSTSVSFSSSNINHFKLFICVDIYEV